MALIFTKLTSKLLDDAKESVQYVDDIRMRSVPRAKLPKDTPIRFQIKSEVIVEMASKNALPQPVFASPETVTALVSGALKEQWDTLTKLFYDNVELVSDIFLAKGEESISERFTYLESEFLGHPEGTAAFIRETNYSEYCYLVPSHIVLAGKNKDASCKDLLRIEEPKMVNYGVVRKTSIKDIGGYLAEGVLGGFMGNIGVLIFNSIFPSDMTNFFDAMYKEIEKIVDEALTEEAIDELNGKIYGTEQWVSNTYTALKQGGTYTPEMLTEKLQPVEEDFSRNVIGVLQEERFSKPGICTFLIGAGMHLSILQELALVDFTVTEPEKSSYIQAVKNWAKSYGDYVYRTVDDIMKTRENMIKTHTSDYQTDPFTHVLSAWWTDDYDSTQSKMWNYTISSFGSSGDSDYTKHCKADMDKHVSAVRKDWLERMGDPYVVADTWYKLEETGGI